MHIRKGVGLESFMSEHTAEFTVVRALSAQLESAGLLAIPLYYWASREGSRLSRHVNASVRGRLLAVFPRRPKIDIKNGHTTHWKINHELYSYSKSANAKGIVAIAALPLASSLLELQTALVYWVPLAGEPEDRVLSKTSGIEGLNSNVGVVEDLDQLGILKIVELGCSVMPWAEMLAAMSELRLELNNGRYFFMGGAGYRPVYYLLPE